MKRSAPPTSLEARIKELQAELATLQKEAAKREHATDATLHSITARTVKNQARFVRIRRKDAEDTAVGKFYLEVAVTAGNQDVFIPLSIASGKKVAGFMYQIEGTAGASIITTEIKVRGEKVTEVTLGTLHFARIAANSNATFFIQVEIKGNFGKSYRIVFTRVNYKLHLQDARYQQYLTPIPSKSVKFT
jgi:hypothetical protein